MPFGTTTTSEAPSSRARPATSSLIAITARAPFMAKDSIARTTRLTTPGAFVAAVASDHTSGAYHTYGTRLSASAHLATTPVVGGGSISAPLARRATRIRKKAGTSKLMYGRYPRRYPLLSRSAGQRDTSTPGSSSPDAPGGGAVVRTRTRAPAATSALSTALSRKEAAELSGM